MRDDLLGLEISHNELQKLTNLPVNDELTIIINPLKKYVERFLDRVKGSEGATVVFIGLSILVSVYLVFNIMIRMLFPQGILPSWTLLLMLVFFSGSLTQTFFYLLWKQRIRFVEKNITYSLKILLNDVDRYNAVIKAIDINDQIEAAGNPGVTLKERQKVLEALKLTRDDLIRALKTERILRENKKFIVSKSELFADNLATLTAMQVTEEASEHGRLLNEALQIALDVQHEMRSLQSQG